MRRLQLTSVRDAQCFWSLNFSLFICKHFFSQGKGFCWWWVQTTCYISKPNRMLGAVMLNGSGKKQENSWERVKSCRWSQGKNAAGIVEITTDGIQWISLKQHGLFLVLTLLMGTTTGSEHLRSKMPSQLTLQPYLVTKHTQQDVKAGPVSFVQSQSHRCLIFFQIALQASLFPCPQTIASKDATE